jgi:hypothetical protein
LQKQNGLVETMGQETQAGHAFSSRRDSQQNECRKLLLLLYKKLTQSDARCREVQKKVIVRVSA